MFKWLFKEEPKPEITAQQSLEVAQATIDAVLNFTRVHGEDIYEWDVVTFMAFYAALQAATEIPKGGESK